MATLDFNNFNGTPAFIIKGANPIYGRVHAGTFDKKNTRWLFAAYPPFGSLVVNDLRKVDPTLQFSPAAEEHMRFLVALPKLLEDRVLPSDFTFHTKPFDHQVWGLCLLYYFPRFALWWEPGVGKSKVPLDLMRAIPKQKMLILSQKVTLENWVEQAGIHSPGIRAAALLGTPSSKLEVIRNHKEFDIIVASYGTARTIGLPRLHKETLAFLNKLQKDTGKQLTDSGKVTLAKSVRRLSDADAQIMQVQKWADGQTFASIDREVAIEAAKEAQWLEDIDYNICLVDESQNIKKSDAQQTKTIVELGKKAARRILLSGTPTSGDPRHLYPQMRFLSPSIFPEDWLKFSDLFLVRSPRNLKIVTGYKNLHILNERANRVSDTKKKADCLDLPPRVVTDIRVKMSAHQTKLYNQLVSNMTADLVAFFDNPTGAAVEVQNAATLLNKLAQVTSGFLIDSGEKTLLCDTCPHLQACVTANILPHTDLCQISKTPPSQTINLLKDNPKMDAFEELLDTLLEDPKRKVIVWAYYTAELNALQAQLDRRALKFERMDGKSSNIQAKITRFNNDPDCRVYLGQIGTGVGITLNAATFMIYFSVDWKLDVYLQSIDRNYRAGQTEPVTVYRILAKDTVEEYKYAALDQKKDLSATLTNKLTCVTCPKRIDCLNKSIELFDPGCVHKRSARRTIAKAEIVE